MDISNHSYMCSIICAKTNTDRDYDKLLEYVNYEKELRNKIDKIKQDDALKERSSIFKRIVIFICDIVKGIFMD